MEITRLEMVRTSLKKPVDDGFVSWSKVNVFGIFVCWGWTMGRWEV